MASWNYTFSGRDEPSATVFVGNISYDTDERTLKETFPGTIEVKVIII